MRFLPGFFRVINEIKHATRNPRHPSACFWDEGPGGLNSGTGGANAKLGEGTILSCDGRGERTKGGFGLKTSGTKRRMLNLANLTAY